MPKVILTFLCILCISFLFAQTEKAEILKQNVVLFPDTDAFGFICGEYNNKLYIVTAGHHIYDYEGSTVNIEYFKNSNINKDSITHKGKIIKLAEENDLALVEVSKPYDFRWKQVCLSKPTRGEKITIIGKEKEWFVPSRNSTIEDISNEGKVTVNPSPVLPGTSGGPLVTENGIVGIVTDDDGKYAYGLTMKTIIEELFENYQHRFSLKRASNRWLFVIDADGNSYETKVMKDGKSWMIQNLNLDYKDSWCFDNNPSNCETNGRLYFQEAAEIGCRSLGPGWHLPTEDEWETLISSYTANGYTSKDGPGVDAGRDAFDKLDQARFNLKPSGIYWHGDRSIPDEHTTFFFHGLNNNPHIAFWSSSLANRRPENGIFYFFQTEQRRLYKNDDWPTKRGHAVRCVKSN
ncbi:MAG: FISUMP domain-containing protein [Bacteroidota bacterium]